MSRRFVIGVVQFKRAANGDDICHDGVSSYANYFPAPMIDDGSRDFENL